MLDARLIDVGDVSLFVREMGPRHSVPLFVIHGGPSWDHSYLRPALSLVATDRHVVLWDLRGCGRSARDLGPDAYQPELVVEDLARLIPAMGHEQVDVLGFSTGGQLAQLFAEAHPQAIRRLVLASTTAFVGFEHDLDDWDEYQRRRAAAPDVPDGLDDLATTVAWAQAAATTAIWNLARLDAYLELLRQVRFSGDWLEPFRRGTLHPWRPRNPVEVLTNLSKPILILHGRQDMSFPVQVAERLHQAVPSSRLRVIQEAGHMAQFDQPTAWADAIVDFLTSAAPDLPPV